VDGRPLLWKHRDTGDVENKLVYGTGERFDYVGVANQADTLSRQIWMGSNSAGFAIMNTASYNLNQDQTCDAPDDQEGLFMRIALGRCESLSDFETFMDTSAGHWGLAANFGAIDARGNAAYYEKGYFEYRKYDALDPATAPNGYLIRTNFSRSGTADKGYGFIRYQATEDLFAGAERLSVDFILEEATRNLKHGLQNIDLRQQRPRDQQDQHFVLLQDYVVRTSSASTLLVQGVLPGEDPALTTLWTILGWQPVTTAVPVWVRSADLIPEILLSEDGQAAPLNRAALSLKRECFPNRKGNGADYVDLARLTNESNTGILDRVLEAEGTIRLKGENLLEHWREKGYKNRELNRFNRWREDYVRDFYRSKLSHPL